MISWDTETTGLPPRVTPTRANVASFSHSRIVSLAAVRYTSRGRETASFYRLIRPDGYSTMPEGAYAVHKISYEQACLEGVPFEEAFRDFKEFCGVDAHLLAYNSQFDERMMLSEIIRYDLDQTWWLNHRFTCCFDLYKFIHCTKSGKLERVFQDTFGRAFDAHNSLADARACGELFFHLQEKRDAGRVVNHVPDMPCVTLNASDCATAIGRGIEPPEEVVKNLWAKYHPQTFTEKTFAQKAKELLRMGDVKRIYVDVKKFKTTSSNVLQEKIQSVASAIETKSLEEGDEKILKRYMTSELQKKFARSSGWELETRVLDVCEVAGTEYRVCGRPGEIRDGVLFVVKNRTKSFMGLRDYEEVQCRVYLEMCPAEITTCCLVERFQGQTRFHTVEKDLEAWGHIKLRLHNFFDYFHSVVSA